MSAPTIRLSSYKGPRPQATYQSKMTETEIEEKLSLYKKIKIDDIPKLPLNTHIRYYSITKDNDGNKEKKFRLGGFLENKDNYDKYIILTNRKFSWSVNTKESILYRKMTDEEISKNVDNKTEHATNENKKLAENYEKLKKEYYDIVDKYHRLKSKYEQIKTRSER
jgi:hypothetical protein